MHERPFGKTGFSTSLIGYGAVKIGRNQAIKYPEPFALPDEDRVTRLLNALLDTGISYIDTAPAYGLSEERIGRAISRRKREFVLSTKVGETFCEGQSTFDFSAPAIRHSIKRSLQRLQVDALDVVFLHSSGADLEMLEATDAVQTLCELKETGLIRAIGLSGKTVEGARRSLDWADAIMVTYHARDRSHEDVMADAAERGIAVVVKKGLSSGQLPADEAIRFVLANPSVSSLVVGTLSLDHMRQNIAYAERAALPGGCDGR
jgi:aryl-alcohol dehydrogenase-like predicted oxidoreductase